MPHAPIPPEFFLLPWWKQRLHMDEHTTSAEYPNTPAFNERHTEVKSTDGGGTLRVDMGRAIPAPNRTFNPT
ncbi:MAG: hypothetical protein QHC67_13855 [Sphingobium sp.]|uniref:hypothetical protein n=1 Tax=Sphingobium sp. TaxID=1912891 RepID=UPI0029BCAEFC|nr:hypothetical protein [Sphingobium sp.]MDX3910884.1 hypothetical protein [Sphingobium sp.]